MTVFTKRHSKWIQSAIATALFSVALAPSAHAASQRGFGGSRVGGGSGFSGGMPSQSAAQPRLMAQPKTMQPAVQPQAMPARSFAQPKGMAQQFKPIAPQSKPMSQSGLQNAIKPQVVNPSRRPGVAFPGKQTLPGKQPTPGRVVQTLPKKPATINPQIINPQVVKPGVVRPIGKNPIVTKPAFPKPIGNDPIVTRPIFPKPGTNPVLTRPGKIADALPIGKKPSGISVKPISIDPARLKPGMKKPDLSNAGNVKPRPGLADKLNNGKLADVLGGQTGKKLDLGKQFDLKHKGDVARRLDLFGGLQKKGGWHDRMFCGPIAPGFKHNHFGCWYPGPSCYPSYCWAPCWNPWVQWCWWDYCYPVCDPRPIWCRPICYDPCGPWVHWQYPIWRPLPVVVCGTWVDVPVVHVPAGLDLQLLAVRFVDPGHPEQQLGPRYRVWFRNNSPVDIHRSFDVMLLASNDDVPSATLPQAGVRVTEMAAGAIQAIDIRLPFEANVMNTDASGRAIPFDKLHVLVDARREIVEAFEENNGQIMARVDVFPVDPAVFAADVDAAPAGSAISVAGEGLGPEPGRVLVFVGGLELEAVLEGWYDLGVRLQLPGLQVAAPTAAEIVVVRGDGAAADPLSFTLLPQATNVVAAPLPAL